MKPRTLVLSFVLLAFLLSACNEATPVPCSDLTQMYVREVMPLVNEFLDTVDVASATSRIVLAPIVQDLQRIKRQVEQVEPPACAENASIELETGMDYVIDGFIAFLQEDEEKAQRDFETGDQMMARALDSLTDLASE